MNETILNGLLNLFAIFASSVRIEREQASRAVHSYLSSHFGVRSHKEYIELYNALRDMYDDSLFVLDKEQIVRNICEQMKVKLRAEEQLLLLIRFVEFAYTNSEEADQHLVLFRLVADIFSIPQEEFDDALAFITGQTSLSLLTISGEEEAEVLSSSEAEVAEDSVEVASAEEWEEAEVPVPDSDLPKNLLLFY